MLLLRLKKLARILQCRACWRGLLLGVAASMEHERLLRWLESQHCRTVVDIGANRGQFALAAHGLIPQARIFSFEPLAKPAQKFREVFGRVRQVRLQQVAIGPECRTTQAHVSKCDDSSSLLPLGDLLEQAYPGTAEVCVETVRVERLVDLLSAEQILSPALLKLDVQGYELEALKGCSDILGCFAFAYVECSFVEFYTGQALAGEVIAFLREQGFCLAGIYNLDYARTGTALQGDFLFVKAGDGIGRLPARCEPALENVAP